MGSLRAIGLVSGYMLPRDGREMIEAWQHVIDNRVPLARHLAETAKDFIAAGVCSPPPGESE